MKKIALIPIDNRPICYTLVEQICAVNEDLKLYLPERKLLGGLTDMADVSGILNWLKSLPDMDYIILSLDTIAYGGLWLQDGLMMILTKLKPGLKILKKS